MQLAPMASTNSYRVRSILLLLILTSCSDKKKDDDIQTVDAPSAEVEAEDRLWWVQKANNTLRLAQTLPSDKSIEDLAKLPPRGASLSLMTDDSFYDMLADFTLYWMGMKPAEFRHVVRRFDQTPVTDEQGKEIVWLHERYAEVSQGYFGALAVSQNKDYFEGVFSKHTEAVVKSYSRPSYYKDHRNVTQDLNYDAAEKIVLERINEGIAKASAYLEPLDRENFCKEWLIYFGEPELVLASVRYGRSSSVGRSIYGRTYEITEACKDSQLPWPENMADRLKNFKNSSVGVPLAFSKLDRDLNRKNPLDVQHVLDLHTFDTTGVKSLDFDPSWNDGIFSDLPNSSTNRNRKRAAWVLQRFFCDDMTPLNVEIPAMHAAETHGSNPACYSCHYKLDPMAGHFRELGIAGINFSQIPQIFFDDGATANKATYELPWKADPSTHRAWNIGYIRSTTNEAENTYGADFDDLLKLLRTAPEVKECFVRRVFEYAVGGEQTFDRQWGKEVVERMNATAKESPTMAIKGVFADVITSKAFSVRERNNNTCYDLPMGASSENRAPCRIAAVLERNCSSCHNPTNKQGGLDLLTWKVLKDGSSGFSWIKNGAEQPGVDLMAAMSERLNTPDDTRRMPLMKTMAATEREELFLWLQKKINPTAK